MIRCLNLYLGTKHKSTRISYGWPTKHPSPTHTQPGTSPTSNCLSLAVFTAHTRSAASSRFGRNCGDFQKTQRGSQPGSGWNVPWHVCRNPKHTVIGGDRCCRERLWQPGAHKRSQGRERHRKTERERERGAGHGRTHRQEIDRWSEEEEPRWGWRGQVRGLGVEKTDWLNKRLNWKRPTADKGKHRQWKAEQEEIKMKNKKQRKKGKKEKV